MAKEIENFEEFKKKVFKPEIDIYKLIRLALTSNFHSIQGLQITANFDYDLNPEKKSLDEANFAWKYQQLQTSIMLNAFNKMSLEEKQKYQKSYAHPEFVEFLKKILNKKDYEDCMVLDRNNDTESKMGKLINGYKKITNDKHDLTFNPCGHEWYYFRSENLVPTRKEIIKDEEVKHRLYLAINLVDRMDFCKDFIVELENRNLPYKFKIYPGLKSGKQDQNDTIVIYADTEERVVKYTNIINNIIEKNDKYKKSIHTPSAHLGAVVTSVGKYIGYGPQFSSNTSYTGVVGEIISNAKTFAHQYVSKKYNIKITNEQLVKLLDSKYNLSSNYYNVLNDFINSFKERLPIEKAKYGLNPNESFCFNKIDEKYKMFAESMENNSKESIQQKIV